MMEKIKKLLDTEYVNDNPYKLIFDFKKKYPEKFKEAYQSLKMERIKDANEACDSQPNCVHCSKCYKEMDDVDLIPCNYIRALYGESIWSYK